METPGFARQVGNGVPYYCCRALEELPFLRHGFSTRHGGVSPLPDCSLNLSHVPWDKRDRVKENRRRFLAALGLPAVPLATLRQVHSDRLHIIRDDPAGGNPGLEGDALATERVGIALAVQVADCYPLLIVDPENRAIAAIHAGWRGVLARIVSKAIRSLLLAFHSDSSRLLVAIGPGIGPCCMEVGPEVTASFDAAYPGNRLWAPHPGRPGKRLLDLPAAMEIQLREGGVLPAHVFDLNACTRCRNDEFFSYRADGPRSGRMMGVIALTGTGR
jgi:YfiH family protein